MKNYAAILLILSATPASAADGKAVFDCLGEVGASTTWEQCLGAMFEPCEDLSVGGDAHLTCLSRERDDWLDRLQTDQADVMEILAPKGAAELEGLLSAWPTYVQSKCASVADSRAHISYRAAYLGCEITEAALIANELRACQSGMSIEDYCIRKSGQ
jgi:hypothetical protein